MSFGAEFTRAQEGFTPVAKPDAKGAWVVGHGHDIPPSPGLTWTLAEADHQFYFVDYPRAQAQAAEDVGPSWASIDEVRQGSLCDMAFEMGGAGLAEFDDTLAAVRVDDWNKARTAILQSRYATEVSTRADAVAEMLGTGVAPPA